MITIAISGHRILSEIDKINTALDLVLKNIKLAFPDKSYTLLSQLAEGADRLAAISALKQDIHLVVPLPLAKADYLTDFSNGESKLIFENLLARAQTVLAPPPAATRNAAYLAVGTFMLEHCDVLIAIWDGQGAQGQGGTGEIVLLSRQRGLPLAWIHAGNRTPGTMEATSMGAEQGTVTYERFPVHEEDISKLS